MHWSIGRLVRTQLILWVTDYYPNFLFPHGQLGVSLRVNKSMGHSARIRVFTLYNTLHAVLCTYLYFKISLWLYSHNIHCIPVQIVSIGMSMGPQCILFSWPLKQSTCLGKSVSVDLLNWGGYRVCCCLLQNGATSPQLLFSGVRKSCNSKWSEFIWNVTVFIETTSYN